MRETAGLGESLLGTVRMSRALAQARRPIDLSGLDEQVGRLCARVLDLDPGQGAALRPLLVTLLAEIEACIAD